MKKYAIILALSLITITGISQGISQAIKPFAMFEGGYIDYQTMIYGSEYERFVLGVLPTHKAGPYYGKLVLGASYKGFMIYMSDKTFFNKDRSIYFNPQVIEYTIGTSFTHERFKLGFEHTCGHSVGGLSYSLSDTKVYFRVVIGNPDKNLW